MPEFRSKVTIGNVVALKETTAALLCQIDGDEVWIPQSQIDDDSEVFGEGDHGDLVISEWIATQKGLDG